MQTHQPTSQDATPTDVPIGMPGLELERLTIEIFQRSGYEVSQQPRRGFQVDFEAILDTEKYLVEVKASSSTRYTRLSIAQHAAVQLSQLAATDGCVPVLVVFASLSPQDRSMLSEQCPSLRVLDISNMLYAVRGTSLEDVLVGTLPYSVAGIQPTCGELRLGWIEHQDERESLKRQLMECKPGRDECGVFEKRCIDALRLAFSGELALWRQQQRSNNNLYRFDLICRIKDNVPDSFWAMMDHHFNSKYVVFEFKNYTRQVTQKEVYSTERYLYRQALRNVAIMISSSGYDNHARWAAKGSLRENGKLILLLTVNDLIALLDLSRDQQDPSLYLLDKVDELLIDLEK